MSKEFSSHSYRRQNQAAWNRLSDGSQFAKVASDEELRDPLKALDGRNWLPASVAGLHVLCLASGGGWQSILYAGAGAHVTVVDLSPGMLELDRREATRRGLTVTTIEASMDDLSMLPEESFDIVHQPVSTCYVPSIVSVYEQIARLLRDGGLYISQHKQPICAQITEQGRRHLVPRIGSGRIPAPLGRTGRRPLPHRLRAGRPARTSSGRLQSRRRPFRLSRPLYPSVCPPEGSSSPSPADHGGDNQTLAAVRCS